MTSMSSWLQANLFRARSAMAHLALLGLCGLSPAFAQETPDPVGNSAKDAPPASGAAVNEAGSANSEAGAAGRTPSGSTMGLRPEPVQTISHRLTSGERLRIYQASVFNPTTLTSPALGAAIDQWQDEPTEWGQGMAGYGRRLGSGLGRNLANKSIIFGVAALDGEDPRYFRSDSPGIVSRSGHAVVSAFISYREDGSRAPAYAHFAGAYGSSFLANSWYPPSKATAEQALVRGTTKLGMNAAMNVLREFWPDLKRRLHFGR
jgi:hypothetical protein